MKAHVEILKSLDELPFNIGKTTLMDFVKGDSNGTIDKNKLYDLESYGKLYIEDKFKISKIIEVLIKNKLINRKIIRDNISVLEITPLGRKEIYEKSLNYSLNDVDLPISIKKFPKLEVSRVNEMDKKLFESFSFFLEKFNDEQKKAIISNEKNILCIAGAGSGKTTVLVNRIEFLTKFRSVKEEEILAVTFTRKARDEMLNRLKNLNLNNVKVETFNSFCEKILKKYEEKVYGKKTNVATFGDKIRIVRKAMEETSLNLEVIAEDYFNQRQLKEKSGDELLFIFVNDIFSIVDFYKNRFEEIEDFSLNEKAPRKRRVAKAIFEIVKIVHGKLREENLRDYTDQIIDTFNFFEKEKDLIPNYEHVLVDEFQDLNLTQYKLLKVLNSKNVFVVGDPRQAIYEWRGSDVKYIYDFIKDYKDSQVLTMNNNYRSRENIVELFNKSISAMEFDDLVANREDIDERNIFLLEMQSEELERITVCQSIKKSKVKRSEIFILARTNRILENFAHSLTQQGIDYAIKSEEDYKVSEPKDDQVVLATVHSIKGMEASEVYVVGSNTQSYPNRVQDNFVLDLVKNNRSYDKYSEELRLFYVALSRAKDKVIVTYTGNITKFIRDDMLHLFNTQSKQKSLFDTPKVLDSGNSVVLKNLLKNWRTKKSNESGLPSYMVISNAAIDDIVLKKPGNKYDLEAINGLGPVKIAKYGEEILSLLNG